MAVSRASAIWERGHPARRGTQTVMGILHIAVRQVVVEDEQDARALGGVWLAGGGCNEPLGAFRLVFHTFLHASGVLGQYSGRRVDMYHRRVILRHRSGVLCLRLGVLCRRLGVIYCRLDIHYRSVGVLSGLFGSLSGRLGILCRLLGHLYRSVGNPCRRLGILGRRLWVLDRSLGVLSYRLPGLCLTVGKYACLAGRGGVTRARTTGAFYEHDKHSDGNAAAVAEAGQQVVER